jgi:hypothetical protein
VPEEPSQEDKEDYGEEEESYHEEKATKQINGKGERLLYAKDIKVINAEDS